MAARRLRGLPRARMALGLGVSLERVRAWELGQRAMQTIEVAAIGDLLNVPLDFIVRGIVSDEIELGPLQASVRKRRLLRLRRRLRLTSV